jgi:hypothetical protein
MYYLKMWAPGSGLTNQMFAFVTGLITAFKERESVVVADSFLDDVNETNTTPIAQVLDLEAINVYLKSHYNLIVVDRYDIDFTILQARYGTATNFVDITDYVVDKFRRDNRLCLTRRNCAMNDIKGDPCPGVAKQLSLRYMVCGHVVDELYEEHLGRACIIDFDTVYNFKLGWITRFNNGMFNKLLTNIRYHQQYVDKSDLLLRDIDVRRTVNVIHLRLEEDGIKHWAKKNNMSNEEFRHHLEDKYIGLIGTHMRPADILLVLSQSSCNRVTEYLTDRGYTFRFIQSPFRGREKNAIVDLLASQRCNNTFIGNFNLLKSNGSTFSYYVGRCMGNGVAKVCVDLDHVRDIPFITNH